jgi:hypothetical protein
VVLAEIGSAGAKCSQVSDTFGRWSAVQGRLGSSNPSDRLEQEAQTFGFRESVLALSAKGSPQQIQFQNLILCGESITYDKAVSVNQVSAPILLWENPL